MDPIIHRPGQRPDRKLRGRPMDTNWRHTNALTRRDMLRSMGLLGALVAAPPLLSGCGESAARPQGPVRVSRSSVAQVDVSRSLNGGSARTGTVAAVQAFTADLYKELAATPGN